MMNSFRSRLPIMIYILHSGNLYGTERMALATLEGMNEYGMRVVVAPRPSGTGSVTQAATQAGYATVTFHTRWQLLKGLLPWFLRHRTIDVIGVGVGSSMMCYMLSRLLRVRLRQLQVAHGGTEDALAYASKRRLNVIPIGLVAVSEFVRRKLLEHGVRPDSVTVIDNFLSEQQRLEYGRRAPYDNIMAGARPLNEAAVRVAIVSRVDGIKKIDILLQAIEMHGLRNFQFDIYGTGEELSALIQRSATMPNVCFHGYRQDVKDRLIEADLLLHLCPVEPFGLVILEAFLSRLVVIVADAGGAGDLVQDGLTGLHFRSNNADDVARVLEVARGLPAPRLQQLADAAATVLEERFSQSHGIRRYREALKTSTALRHV